MIPDLKPELKEMISQIGSRNIYGGNKIPQSIIDMFEIEETESNCGVLVPYWLPVFQKGRGPRKNNKDHGLVNKIYRWMQKNNMFKSKTDQGKFNEARSLTWYINKYGNKQFRNKIFIDVYNTVVKETAEAIDNKYDSEITKLNKILFEDVK